MRECSLARGRHAPDHAVCGDEGDESRASITDAEIISACHMATCQTHPNCVIQQRTINLRYIRLPNARAHGRGVRRQRIRGAWLYNGPSSTCRVPPTTRMGAIALQQPAPSLFFEDKLLPSSSEIAAGSRPNSVNLNSHSTPLIC